MTHLTPPERETVINFSDEEKVASVWTAQRPIITKLKNNPAAVLVEEGFHGSTAWARFEFPADLISFRSGKRTMSPENRAAAAERMRKLRESAA